MITDSNEWNKMFPFKGTTNLYGQEIKIEEEQYEDDEWNAPVSNNVIVLNNSLGALMGAYISGDESDEIMSAVKNISHVISHEFVKENQNSNTKGDCVLIKTNNCDVAPNEIKLEKMQEEYEFEHLNNKNENKEIIRRGNVQIKEYKVNTLRKSSEFSFKRRKVTLLEKLLQSEIRQERNVLLQCIRYVINKKFLK